jgi:hypothetical protein
MRFGIGSGGWTPALRRSAGEGRGCGESGHCRPDARKRNSRWVAETRAGLLKTLSAQRIHVSRSREILVGVPADEQANIAGDNTACELTTCFDANFLESTRPFGEPTGRGGNAQRVSWLKGRLSLILTRSLYRVGTALAAAEELREATASISTRKSGPAASDT